MSDGIEILLGKWLSSEYLPEIHKKVNYFKQTLVSEKGLI